MLAPFLGFGPKALEWFRGLEADNSKGYFEATRGTLEAEVRGPLERLLEELAVDLGGRAKLFRQNRDIRFSKDKSPYKTNSAGVIHVPGSQSGLFVSISARGLHSGSGYWHMAADQLERYRTAVQAAGGPELARRVEAMEADGLALEGAALKAAPRGVARDHPLIRLLRMKDVLALGSLGPDQTLDGRRSLEFARSVWDRSRPVMEWMDAHVGPTSAPPEVRPGRRR